MLVSTDDDLRMDDGHVFIHTHTCLVICSVICSVIYLVICSVICLVICQEDLKANEGNNQLHLQSTKDTKLYCKTILIICVTRASVETGFKLGSRLLQICILKLLSKGVWFNGEIATVMLRQ